MEQEQDTKYTKVIFKAFHNGEIIALFPQRPANMLPSLVCASYQHVGQHGAASVELARALRPATPAEADPLRLELESLGYRLRIAYRMSRKDLQARINICTIPD